MGAEAFTVLAILEARDRASAVVERINGTLNQFSASAERAAATAETAGAGIDTSLLQTASGTDAAVLASTRLEATRTQLVAATNAQANAERLLMDAQAAAAAAAEGDAEAHARLTAAVNGLSAAEKRAAKASSEVAAAQERQAAIGQTVIARADEQVAASDKVVAAQTRIAASATASAGPLAGASKALKLTSVAAAAVAVVSVKAAGDFESSTQHLVTDAGEAQKNLGMIQKGILGISSSTGTAASSLSAAMYHIESAGFHGASGLKLLQTAAQGAKVGGADFETVAKTLTGTMNSYGMSGDQAVGMMNQLITTTASGDMRMQDLASSLGNVVPLAAAAGLSFSQVGGALATMTAQNMSAQQGAQDLANTIRALSNPNNVAIKEMQNLGLSSNDLSMNLGKRGLTGTLEILTRAVAAHTKGGAVLIASFNASKQAAADANTMIASMPPNLQKVATSYLNGTTTLGDWRKELKTLPPIQAAMMAQFGTLANKTHSFNDMLKNGGPAAQTYNAAMAKLLGGATGLNTSLMITGGRMGTFKDATDKISEAANRGGRTVEDWDKIQQTFNQKIDRLKYSTEAAGISIGMVLLPAAEKIADVFTAVMGPIADFTEKHEKLVGLVASVAGGMLIAAGAIKAVALATKLWAAAQEFVNAAMAVFDAEEALTGIPELIILIAALAAGLIYAWDHFSTFREVVVAALSAVKTAGLAVWHALIVAWDAIVSAAMATWHALDSAWRAVAGAAKSVWGAVAGAWNAVWSATEAVWSAISGFFEKWWPLLLVVFMPPIALLLSLWNHFHEQAFAAAKTAWDAIAGFFAAIWGAIKTGAALAWAGIKIAIVDPVMDVWHGLQAIWNAISPWLAKAWTGIEAGARAVWGSIKSAIVDPLTSTWHAVATLASSIAKSLSDKLNSALKSAKTEAGKFLDVGKAVIDGIVHGIENGAGAVADAAKHAASGALNAAKNFLGISSPSKKFKELGGYVVDGLVQGLTGSTASVKAAGTRIAKDLYVDFGGSHERLQKGVAKDNALLNSLAKNRDNVAAKLKAAQKQLATLQAGWTKERDSVASSIMQNASVVIQPPQYQTLTSSDVLKNLQQQAAAANAFAKQLDELRKKGLSTSLIQQIAAAGVDQGGATAAALAGASKAQIDQMNKTQAGMQSAANSTGAAVADSMYKTGIQSAQGLIKGLQSQESAIEKQMLKIAKSMQAAIKKALGIRSPSTVFADEVGKHIPAGIAQGVSANARVATAAVANLSTALVGAASSKNLGSGFMTTGAGLGTARQNGGIVINIDARDATLMSDRDMDLFANKLGRTLATKALPQGGVRIRM